MFDAYIGFHARMRPDAPAIVTPDHVVSFARLDADVDRMAAALAAIGVPAGAAAAIDCDDEYARWLVLLALARRGIASAPATEPCTVRIGDRPGATVPLDPPNLATILRTAHRPCPPTDADPDALGRILRSSGTTGEEKRLAMTWRTIDAGIRNSFVAYGLPQGPWAMLTGLDSILGLLLTLAAWAGGQPVVLGIGLAITPELAARLRPALVALVPDQLRRWLALLPADAAPQPIRIVSGGGAIAPALAADVARRLTRELRSVYGAAETGAVAVADGALLARELGAAGFPLPGVDVEIVAGDGLPIARGAIGLVRIRSDRTARSYIDGARSGTSSFRDGWFVPGDIGRIDAHGLLTIEGRIDELMNVGGHKLLPGWIEAAALACPGVTEAAAFALADDAGIDACWLAIVSADGFDAGALTQALRGPLERVERLRWIVVPAIPRNAMGKILREPLRALAAAQAGAAPG